MQHAGSVHSISVVVRPGRRSEKGHRNNEKCGFVCCHPSCLQRFASVKLFVFIMCVIIAIQGIYLGYMIAVLTNIERRFEISSQKSGMLISAYDVGHTIAVILVGHFGGHQHKAHWTGAGVVLSVVAMLGLSIPNFVYGPASDFEQELLDHHDLYVAKEQCDGTRDIGPDSVHPFCRAKGESQAAFAIFLVSQLLAGVAAAPFNTLAYIYIDENVEPRQSPFYLGLLTSMYAFGPAFGFALGAACLSLYADPFGAAPGDLLSSSPNWVGAWWLGFLVCAALYLIFGLPIFLFPRRLPEAPHLPHHYTQHHQEMVKLDQNGVGEEGAEPHKISFCQRIADSLRELPIGLKALALNPVFVSMVVGWVFGSYLVGGYATYLPKFLETQYGATESVAALYSGLISIGSVAVSTAIGGFLLTRLNLHPRKATALLVCSWLLLMLTYLLGMGTGCVQPRLEGQHVPSTLTWNFTTQCNAGCHCDAVYTFDPVCDVNGTTHFSPCHAGCLYDEALHKWDRCSCAAGDANETWGPVSPGWCDGHCGYRLPLYITIMFVGLFLGNLFFMTTMMVVLRCVEDDLKALALSVASCATNVLGFIPAPIIFGSIIDSSCVAWHSLCPEEQGNCILYDNKDFRHKYHLTNAGFQMIAVVAVSATFIISSKCFTFPEDRDEESEYSDFSREEDVLGEIDS